MSANAQDFLHVENISHPLPQDSGAVGAEQRLRIYVPSANTQLTLGQALVHTTPMCSLLAYRGIGLQTAGHVFVSAHGGVGESTMTLQANGRVILQSAQAGMYVSSKGNALFGSSATTMLGGRGGVLVVGGLGIGEPVSDVADGVQPTDPEALAASSAAMQNVGRFWAGVDGAVAALGIALDISQGRIKWRPEKRSLRGWMATAFNLLPTMSSALCAGVNGIGIAGADPVGGTVVHGGSGLIAGSPGFTSLYGGVGLTVGSGVAAFVGAPWVTIGGPVAVDISSRRTVSLDSGDVITVAAKNEANLNARSGTANVVGKIVEIGALEADESQAATEGVSVSATKVANLYSKENTTVQGDASVMLGGKTIGATGEDIEMTATKALNLSGGEKLHAGVKGFRLSIDANSLVLGQGAPIPNPPAKPQPHRKSRTRKKQSDTYRQKVQEWESKVKEHHAKYAAAKKSQVGIWMTEGKIELLVQGSKLVGTSSGWKFNGTALVIKT